MKHAFSYVEHLEEGLSSKLEPVLTDSLKKDIDVALLCFKQVLARDQVEHCSHTGVVEVRRFVAVPEASHQEVVVGQKSAECLLNVD